MSELKLEEHVRIDRFCDEFERSIRDGDPIPVEKLMERVPRELKKQTLRELLALEIELCHTGDETRPDVAMFCRRFPDDEDVVRRVMLEADISDAGEANGVPERIDRYEVEREVGVGSFGRVLLARDPKLGRRVAVKVPNESFFRRGFDVSMFVDEARTAASLTHPAIVTIHDVQAEPGSPVFIVQEFIEGKQLNVWCEEHQPDHRRIVELLIEVIAGVGYAHRAKVYHRDLKPANILIDNEGRPHVADFGLAIHEDLKDYIVGQVTGSPAYMAPEQVRGETHRIDGRTDIWALGVILYDLLTGQRPFRAPSDPELFVVIQELAPLPLADLAPHVPAELERICLRCLEKRKSARYASCEELREDLEEWLCAGDQVASDETGSTVKVVPRGLRAFDQRDADFFCDLLPGPRDRRGVPESVRFWAMQIEEPDPLETFPVGLMFGPSGCGKSSLVRAGIIPQLRSVIPLYIEATPHDTEIRLLKSIRKHVSLEGLGGVDDLTLPEVIRAIRERSSGPKVVVFLDQFEQWLHSHPDVRAEQLVDALRQCDGGSVQAVIMTRDDFFMSATRLMKQLDLLVVEGENAWAVDTFSLSHAGAVLEKFGQAHGSIATPPTEANRQFLGAATSQLAENGKVVSIRLSMFAQMMRNREWTLAFLESVGGEQGVGVRFLEETFEAPGRAREHQAAIRGVLGKMLPEGDMNIKAAMQSEEQLRKAAEYDDRPQQFTEVITLLDRDLRLITPTDPDNSATNDADGSNGTPGYYQLAHDYLVPTLRSWLTARQRETWRGRAALTLEERAAVWTRKPEPRNLPSLLELLQIRAGVGGGRYTENQRKMVATATRRHLRRLAVVLATVGMVATILLMRSRTLALAEMKGDMVSEIESLADSSGPDTILATERILDRKYPKELLLSQLDDWGAQHAAARQLPLQYLRARLSKPDHAFFAKQLPSSDPRDAELIITGLGKDCVPDTIPGMVEEFVADVDLKTKIRAAWVTLRAGSPQAAIEIVRDPEARPFFIDECKKWLGDLDELCRVTEETQEPELRRALILICGSKLTDTDSGLGRRGQKLFTEAYTLSPHRGVHAAASWALRTTNPKWLETAPETCPDESEWRITKNGITMMRQPGGPLSKGAVKRLANMSLTTRDPDVDHVVDPFWVADREISRRLYLKWKQSTDASKLDYPAEFKSHAEALEFCSWLSVDEGLTPCYSNVDGDWKFDFDANGYRLLTCFEWTWLSKADRYSVLKAKVSQRLARDHAAFLLEKNVPCGAFYPSPSGIFDLVGSLWDLGITEHDAGPLTALSISGGKYNEARVMFGQYQNRKLGTTISDTGLRVVRTALD